MKLPYSSYRQTWVAQPKTPYAGLDRWTHHLLGAVQRYGPLRFKLFKQAEKIHQQASALQTCTDHELNAQVEVIQVQFQRHSGQPHKQPISEGLTLLVELARRTLNLHPYPSQIMAVLGLCRGYLTEMQTGEGKSLVVALRGVLAAWGGRPCHCITANDYLAKRDCDTFTPLFERCGLSSGVIQSGMTPEQRQPLYAQSVVYVTAKELVFDFLRDRLKLGGMQHPTRRLIEQQRRGKTGQDSAGLILQGLESAIVDEADSLLIDEATTPVVISTQRENLLWKEAVQTASDLANQLDPETDFLINTTYKEVSLTAVGRQKLRDWAHQLPPVWRAEGRQEELIHSALLARRFYLKDRDYVIQEEKVVIVDEYSGRLMPGRTWGGGLHQAVEAMEGLEITPPSESLARLSYQRFFRMFRNLCGLTGTAADGAGEFWRIYRLLVLPIPPHNPCQRHYLSQRVFVSESAKLDAIVEESLQQRGLGRPVLIGTRSIHASEKLAERFELLKIPCHLLNATQDEQESQIVAGAGQPQQLTIATNMAGRGTDIQLGAGVAQSGGLHVMATERHDARRIDRQLYGRCARQGDPGSVRLFSSVEDELAKRHLPGVVQRLLQSCLKLRLPGSQWVAGVSLRHAQHRSEKRSAAGRMQLLWMDNWLQESLSFGKRQGV
ncbi:preprotein translocase subunit SecA [Magnetococcus sp. PR-3]|uniref:preprotein translocase subunit SecA n=1 Tax=Magnetococcus sp. PR-3 TaxID=3120355 RepID=UPI002FCE2BD4